MSPIYALPLEILYAIADMGLDEDDLLSLRLVSKILNFRVHDVHLNVVFQTRYVYLVPDSLKNLLNVAKHISQANLRVRRLVISSLETYAFNTLDDPASEFLEMATNTEEFQILRQMYHTSLSFTEDTSRMRRKREHVSYLIFALYRFPFLKEIIFQNGEKHVQIPRSVVNLFHPSLGFKPGRRIPESEHRVIARFFGSEAPLETLERTNIWREVIDAISVAGLRRVQKIGRTNLLGSGVSFASTFSLSPQQMEKYQRSFSNLRKLHLQISVDCYRPEYNERNGHFCNWLDMLGTQLRELTIVKSVGYGPKQAILFPNAIGLPKLQRLHLFDIKLEYGNFREFLRHSEKTLKNVYMEGCKFEDHCEESCKFLKYANLYLPALQDFQIDVSSLCGTRDSVLFLQILRDDRTGTKKYQLLWRRDCRMLITRKESLPDITQLLGGMATGKTFWSFVKSAKGRDPPALKLR
ncbi:hypothetical protein TWF481_002146 [Arthrobotrys musiformis]|uniref:F-box domain-containing protein n=1 Tax=Arthrobotrys musiformis TaxID=47236 RepID=A0AAV9VTG9_9PEZI